MADLTLYRTLAAMPSQVWDAFTDAAQLSAWLWPGSWQTTALVDPFVGGRYRIASPVSGVAVAGTFLEVERPHRLALTWQWDGESEQTTVTITISATGNGATELTLEHCGFYSAESRENHAQGWIDCLERLPAHVDAATSQSQDR